MDDRRKNQTKSASADYTTGLGDHSLAAGAAHGASSKTRWCEIGLPTPEQNARRDRDNPRHAIRRRMIWSGGRLDDAASPNPRVVSDIVIPFERVRSRRRSSAHMRSGS
jgi:hypothetical protein